MCSRYLIGDGMFEALKEGFFDLAPEEGEDFFLPFLRLRGDIRPSMQAPVLVREPAWTEDLGRPGEPQGGGRPKHDRRPGEPQGGGLDGLRGGLNRDGNPYGGGHGRPGAGELRLKKMVWGFPAQEGKGLVINARCETVLEKKLFSESVRTRRCLIPASGFYEWSQRKDPYFFAPQSVGPQSFGMQSVGSQNSGPQSFGPQSVGPQSGQEKGRLLLMAGFYRSWEGTERFVILTTRANASVCGVHPRMPLILEPEDARLWLEADRGAGAAESRRAPEDVPERPEDGRPEYFADDFPKRRPESFLESLLRKEPAALKREALGQISLFD